MQAVGVDEPPLGRLVRYRTRVGHGAIVGRPGTPRSRGARPVTTGVRHRRATLACPPGVGASDRGARRPRAARGVRGCWPSPSRDRGPSGPAWDRPGSTTPRGRLSGEASEIAGRDLTALLLEAPMDELTRTANAQLATFVMSLVVLDAVERLGLSPAACAGHSLGEYTALVASGALSLADGTSLVIERGDAMQEAADEHAGDHGRPDRHRRRRRRGRLPAGRGRGVGGQLQRARAGGDRRNRRRGRRRQRPRQGARAPGRCCPSRSRGPSTPR